MADPLKVISDSNGVSREEALFYLEGFNFDLNSAIEACRNKTLPPLTALLTDDESSPEVSINVESATESLSTPPRLSESVQISDQAKSECMKAFVDAIYGTTPRDALDYLTRFNWNLSEAVNQFIDESSTPSQRSSQVNSPANPPSNDSAELLRSLPDFENFDPTQHYATGTQIGGSSSSSSWMEIDQTELLIEAAEMEASSKANVETSVSEESAETLPMVIDSRGSLSQLQSLREPLIDSIIGLGGVTRENAIACLELHNWDVHKAGNSFFVHSSDGVFSEEETLAAMELSLKESRGNQGEIGSSSSSFTADPTETERPFSEAGLLNVPVAGFGIATSQAVKNWNPGAVDEDPSTETGPDPLATQDSTIVEPQAGPITTEIKLQIVLCDGKGTELSMTFRPDQTLRDIHNRIEELRPDDNKNYFLTSGEGYIYNDLDATVERICSRGGPKFLQFFS